MTQNFNCSLCRSAGFVNGFTVTLAVNHPSGWYQHAQKQFLCVYITAEKSNTHDSRVLQIQFSWRGQCSTHKRTPVLTTGEVADYGLTLPKMQVYHPSPCCLERGYNSAVIGNHLKRNFGKLNHLLALSDHFVLSVSYVHPFSSLFHMSTCKCPFLIIHQALARYSLICVLCDQSHMNSAGCVVGACATLKQRLKACISLQKLIFPLLVNCMIRVS